MTPERRHQLLMASRLGQAILSAPASLAPNAGIVQFAYNEKQPRAKDGRFGSVGSDGKPKADKAASGDAVRDLNTKLAARDGDTKTSDVNAMMRAAAGLTESQAKSVWKDMGRKTVPKTDHRRLLMEDIEGRQGAKLRSAMSYRPSDPRAKVKGHDEPLLGANDLLGRRPAKTSSGKPGVEKSGKTPKAVPAKATATPQEPPATKPGKAVTSIYEKAARATEKDIATAKEHLAAMKPDEIRRVAAATGLVTPKSVSGKALAAKIVARVEDIRGSAIRTKLVNRPGANPPAPGDKPAKKTKVVKSKPTPTTDAPAKSHQELVDHLRGLVHADITSKSDTGIRAKVDAVIKSVKKNADLVKLYTSLTGGGVTEAHKKWIANRPRAKLEQMVHSATTGIAGSHHRASV